MPLTPSKPGGYYTLQAPSPSLLPSALFHLGEIQCTKTLVSPSPPHHTFRPNQKKYPIRTTTTTIHPPLELEISQDKGTAPPPP